MRDIVFLNMQAIKFSVSYTLSEYLDFIKNHAVIVTNQELASRGKKTIRVIPAYLLPLILIPNSIGFFFKKRRMPVCHFEIDEQHIVRTTLDGVYDLSWNDVIAVTKYPRGYLVSSASGAMPLPFRCLDSNQTRQMIVLMEKHVTEVQATELGFSALQ